MSERLLLRGGYVLSMDETVGELPAGDVLIEDGAIAAVEASIDAEDAELVDVSGHVVMPGFVDTHRHTWQTPFRGVCADWTLEDYFRGNPHVDLAQLLGRGRVRRQLRRCSGSSGGGGHDDSGLLALQQHARARRRGAPGPAGRRHPRDVRLRLLPGADRRRRCSPSTSSGSPTPGASASRSSHPRTVSSRWAWP